MGKVDNEKRRRVMTRSRALGHCICNPRQPCPCETFKNFGVCTCAGEKIESALKEEVKLTQLVHNPGCASKIPPGELESILMRLRPVKDPNVISGLAAGDDAAIYRVSETVHLVETVDVFTPCVDDARTFGRICAANCLSDIYAMGGKPLTALSIVGFPIDTIHPNVLYHMLDGAMETFEETSVALIGGHSFKDNEIKLGFAIVGVIDPILAQELDKPQPGDILVLTKPLGTGILTFARQIGRTYEVGLNQAIEAMCRLNNSAAEAMIAAGASGAVDITGFGLFGHLIRLLRQKQLGARLFANQIPAFDQVLEAIRAGVVPGATERNREFVGEDLIVDNGVDEEWIWLGYDPQTSGGLLITISPNKLDKLLHELVSRGDQGFVIGELTEEPPAKIILTTQAKKFRTYSTLGYYDTDMNTNPNVSDQKCCCGNGTSSTTGSQALTSQKIYVDFLKSVASAGVLDPKTKELILLALVIMARCEPCIQAHYKKATQMGISQVEIDEVAWCAIAMGGAPVMMFYNEFKKKLENGELTNAPSACC